MNGFFLSLNYDLCQDNRCKARRLLRLSFQARAPSIALLPVRSEWLIRVEEGGRLLSLVLFGLSRSVGTPSSSVSVPGVGVRRNHRRGKSEQSEANPIDREERANLSMNLDKELLRTLCFE